jgi:hypothetical protein
VAEWLDQAHTLVKQRTESHLRGLHTSKYVTVGEKETHGKEIGRVKASSTGVNPRRVAALVADLRGIKTRAVDTLSDLARRKALLDEEKKKREAAAKAEQDATDAVRLAEERIKEKRREERREKREEQVTQLRENAVLRTRGMKKAEAIASGVSVDTVPQNADAEAQANDAKPRRKKRVLPNAPPVDPANATTTYLHASSIFVSEVDVKRAFPTDTPTPQARSELLLLLQACENIGNAVHATDHGPQGDAQLAYDVFIAQAEAPPYLHKRANRQPPTAKPHFHVQYVRGLSMLKLKQSGRALMAARQAHVLYGQELVKFHDTFSPEKNPQGARKSVPLARYADVFAYRVRTKILVARCALEFIDGLPPNGAPGVSEEECESRGMHAREAAVALKQALDICNMTLAEEGEPEVVVLGDPRFLSLKSELVELYVWCVLSAGHCNLTDDLTDSVLDCGAWLASVDDHALATLSACFPLFLKPVGAQSRSALSPQWIHAMAADAITRTKNRHQLHLLASLLCSYASHALLGSLEHTVLHTTAQRGIQWAQNIDTAQGAEPQTAWTAASDSQDLSSSPNGIDVYLEKAIFLLETAIFCLALDCTPGMSYDLDRQEEEEEVSLAEPKKKRTVRGPYTHIKKTPFTRKKMHPRAEKEAKEAKEASRNPRARDPASLTSTRAPIRDLACFDEKQDITPQMAMLMVRSV